MRNQTRMASAKCGRNLVWHSKQSNSTDMCIYSIGYLSVIEDIRGSPGLAGSIVSLYGEGAVGHEHFEWGGRSR